MPLLENVIERFDFMCLGQKFIVVDFIFVQVPRGGLVSENVGDHWSTECPAQESDLT